MIVVIGPGHLVVRGGDLLLADGHDLTHHAEVVRPHAHIISNGGINHQTLRTYT